MTNICKTLKFQYVDFIWGNINLYFITWYQICFYPQQSSIIKVVSVLMKRDTLDPLAPININHFNDTGWLGPPNPENVPDDGKLKSEMMVKDNRRYYLDLKENSRGRFLRVSHPVCTSQCTYFLR